MYQRSWTDTGDFMLPVRDCAGADSEWPLIRWLPFAAEVMNAALGEIIMKRTIRTFAFVGLVVASSFALLPSLGLAAEPEGSLVLEATIPLAGVGGRIDHMAVDLKRNQLIVAELGNNTVDIIDLAGHKVVHRITGLHEPQGVGYAEPSDLVLVANAGDGSVQMFQGQDLAPAGSVSLGDDADNIRINPRDGTVVVGYGSGGLAIIDPASRTKIADIKLADHPEGFQIDPNTQHAFINVPGAHEIAVIDFEGRRQRASWRVRGATANFPMALDPSGNLAGYGFSKPAKAGSARSQNRRHQRGAGRLRRC